MIMNERQFNLDGIHSICWSSTIDRFIIITFKQILILEDKTMMLEQCPISLSSID
jgi:hypothetical protein